MDRLDVGLDGGAKLVLLRDDEESYVRLLIPKDGVPTFVMRKVYLPTVESVGMTVRLPYTAHLDGMTIEVKEGQDHPLKEDFTVRVGKIVATGRRIDLHTALWK